MPGLKTGPTYGLPGLKTRPTSGDEWSRDDAAADGVAYELRRAVHVQFLEDVRTVRFDGGGAHRQYVRNFLVAVSLGDQLKDLALAFRQRFEPIDDPLAGEMADVIVAHDVGDRRTEKRFAGRHCFYRANQVGVRGIL